MSRRAEWRIDAVPGEAMATWCRALNDDNPIHVDRAAAERLGFGPRCVNPGPANLAYLLNMLMEAAPAEVPTRLEARFLANLAEGDGATATGERRADGSWAATLTRDDGAPVVTAVVHLAPADRP